MKDVVDIEVVEDRTADSTCDEGFLRVRRLTLRTHYDDGSVSDPYPCDMVSRANVDAVAVVIYQIYQDDDARKTVHVALRSGIRPPVTLRKHDELVQPDERTYYLIHEIVAGLIEDEDVGPDGIERRAAAECLEEAGYEVAPAEIQPLGAPLFASPGASNEKFFLRAVETDLHHRREPTGDGSVMEEAGAVSIMPLDEAIAACRSGEIPDSKTEIALLRLCDKIGYLPQLGCFADDVQYRQREVD